MKMTQFKKLLSLLICIALIAAMALMTTACNDNPVQDSVLSETMQSTEITKLGQGEKVFSFIVIDQNGDQKAFEISTDKETVGEALLEVGVIAGENSEYGLYVKTVNGITLDYNTDGKYWAFYVNDAYAMSGVDATAIVEGERYCFKAE